MMNGSRPSNSASSNANPGNGAGGMMNRGGGSNSPGRP
jgi:hypothetical protein